MNTRLCTIHSNTVNSLSKVYVLNTTDTTSVLVGNCDGITLLL